MELFKFKFILSILSIAAIISTVCFLVFLFPNQNQATVQEKAEIVSEKSTKKTEVVSDSVLLLQYENVQSGARLFYEAGCSSCHATHSKLVGPALADVSKKRNHQWIVQAIKDFDVLVKRGDPEAVALYKEYNKIMMPAHDFLSDKDIEQILLYIKQPGCGGLILTEEE